MEKELQERQKLRRKQIRNELEFEKQSFEIHKWQLEQHNQRIKKNKDLFNAEQDKKHNELI